MNHILKQLSILLLSLGAGFHAFGQATPAGSNTAQAPADQISQLAEMVGLSEAQEAQIRRIVDEITPKLESLQTEAQVVQTDLTELAGPDFDEAAIRAKASELGDLQGEMTGLSIILQSKVDSVFTEEQRKKLEDMQRQQQMQQQMQQQQMQMQIQQQMQQMQQPPKPTQAEQ
jgi:Spy/CpxP family protein refolding chaperone